MDLEDLKRQWQLQADRISSLEARNTELQRKLSVNSISTRRDKLRRTYAIFVVIAAVMIPFSLCLMPEAGFRESITGVFAGLFALELIGNIYIYLLIDSIDITALSTREALKRTIRFQRARSVLKIVYISLTIPVLSVMLYQIGEDSRAALIGGITGAIIGAILGIVKDREIRRLIREMLADLKELEGEM